MNIQLSKTMVGSVNDPSGRRATQPVAPPDSNGAPAWAWAWAYDESVMGAPDHA
ncbi:hypothetical protein C8E99_1763 [Citricoccus muralis]|uniref:Uncharacterized protein n=1 Tax=Citricoccus muralis TaxID=169134 RepID=A0A3D9LDJ3_9MICC|nr:hypothetical protein C8E99_1763 [Citricoccus muralis]